MTDITSNSVINLREVVVNEDNDFNVILGECPYCHGWFAVDWTYLDQVSNKVHCPMCSIEVVFDEEDNGDIVNPIYCHMCGDQFFYGNKYYTYKDEKYCEYCAGSNDFIDDAVEVEYIPIKKDGEHD